MGKWHITDILFLIDIVYYSNFMEFKIVAMADHLSS